MLELGLYDYAIVSDNFAMLLFVLVRDVATFNDKNKESVSATLTQLGFEGYTAPIDTYQETDCVYESTARAKLMNSAGDDAAYKKMVSRLVGKSGQYTVSL